MDVDRALRLIEAGLEAKQAAREIGVPWPSLSHHLRKRGINVRELKRQRNVRRVRELAGMNLTAEQVRAHLGMSAVRFRLVCKRGNISYETNLEREFRQRGERVRALYQKGTQVGVIARREGMKESACYVFLGGVPRQTRRTGKGRPKGHRPKAIEAVQTVSTTQTPRRPVQPPQRAAQTPRSRPVPEVRDLYETGLSLRLIADRLGIDLEEARAHLRESYADALDRDVLDPEARALANTRQRRTRERRRAQAVG